MGNTNFALTNIKNNYVQTAPPPKPIKMPFVANCFDRTANLQKHFRRIIVPLCYTSQKLCASGWFLELINAKAHSFKFGELFDFVEWRNWSNGEIPQSLRNQNYNFFLGSWQTIFKIQIGEISFYFEINHLWTL